MFVESLLCVCGVMALCLRSHGFVFEESLLAPLNWFHLHEATGRQSLPGLSNFDDNVYFIFDQHHTKYAALLPTMWIYSRQLLLNNMVRTEGCCHMVIVRL